MSLLNRVANKEVFDFLKTVTIKSTYFAYKTRREHIRPMMEKFVPEISNPYTIHLAGEYLIDPSSSNVAYRQYDEDRKVATNKRRIELNALQNELAELRRELDERGGTDAEYKELEEKESQCEEDISSNRIDCIEAQFNGFRISKDVKPCLHKNYWRLSTNSSGLVRVPRNEYVDSYSGLPKEDLSPAEMLYFEIRPFIVKDVPDPIGGGYRDIEIPVSQVTFDGEGRLANELRNNELFDDTVYDTMMYVTSLDVKDENGNGVVIPFCLQTLHEEYAVDKNAVHRKTLEAYRLPGKYFGQLCKRYPNQVDLIKAIVYPVKSRAISSLMTLPELEALLSPSSLYALDGGGPYKIKRLQSLATEEYIADLKRRFPNKYDFIKKMGADLEGYRDFDPKKENNPYMEISEARRTRISKAKNFELLDYDVSRLDSTEQVSLLEHLDLFLGIIRTRWAIDGFNFEDNYAATLWSLMWSLLPVALIAKRYANIKTPFVSEQHMWDYLTSKGLGDYKGYLTTDQTWFLYKNIQYIMQHAGQQLTLNILIDNLLSYYGLTLKAKTVVLDTTDSLKKMSKPSTPSIQCQYCARRNVSCFKNITEHWCDEWLDTKNLCKAVPIVLTEEFAGSNKDKVVKALIKSYGLSEEDALEKYRRSFIWKDADVEAIKDDMDRDQLVDMSGRVDSLQVTIEAEHVSGQEPVVNEDIIEQQTKELQHMNGTVAPTKLLELTRTQYNAKFAELFNRFVTETLLRFCPYYNEKQGKFVPRVNCTYGFTTTEGAAEFSFDFGEMMAAAYLGFIREELVDMIIDHLKKNEDGTPTTTVGKYPYGIGITTVDGNKVVIHLPDGSTVDFLAEDGWTRDYITDVVNNFTYKMLIPSTCRTTTTFKFGTPVKQEEIVDSYIRYPVDTLPSIVDGKAYDGPGTPVIVATNRGTSNERYYLVVETDEDPDHIWEDLDVHHNGKLLKLKILGYYIKELQFRNGVTTSVYRYHDNNDEIPLIPKFFRWYYPHLNPDINASEEYKDSVSKEIPLAQHLSGSEYVANEVNVNPNDDQDMAFSISDGFKEVQTGKTYEDKSMSRTFSLFRINQFLDVDDLIKDWVEVPDMFSQQEDVASYIDNMFSILERIYGFASQSGSIRTHLACRTFLENVLCQKELTFKLTEKSTFYDWIANNTDAFAAFKIIDNMKDSDLGWNEFNTTVVQQLLKGCTIPYAKNIITDLQYNKLKKLVLTLSSYRITIMNETEIDRVCNETAAISEDVLLGRLEVNEVIYFDPIGDSEWAPRVGGYMREFYIADKGLIESKCIGVDGVTFKDGDVIVPTTDLRLVAGKQYFELITRDDPIYSNPDPNFVIGLKNWPLAHERAGEHEGDLIGDPELGAPVEMVNIPVFTKFAPYRTTEDECVMGTIEKDITGADLTKYYKYDPEVKKYLRVKLEELEKVLASTVFEGDVPEGVYTVIEGSNLFVYLVRSLGLFEKLQVGDKMPAGKCYEKINIYDLLSIAPGTPLQITRDDKWNWYYSVGTVVDETLAYPAGHTEKEHYKTEDLPVEVSDDKFDLGTEFSNSRTAVDFAAPVYRINIPVEQLVWSDPIRSSVLEKYLYMTCNHEFILEESTEPSLLMEESEYPTT